MSKCTVGNLSVVITRAYSCNDAQKQKGSLAKFSFKLIDPTGFEIVLNNFTLSGTQNSYKVFSPWKEIFDYDAPEEIPESEAVKPLYFVSFFPNAKNDPAVAKQKQEFFNNIAQLVFEKISFFQAKKSNDLSNTSR